MTSENPEFKMLQALHLLTKVLCLQIYSEPKGHRLQGPLHAGAPCSHGGEHATAAHATAVAMAGFDLLRQCEVE